MAAALAQQEAAEDDARAVCCRLLSVSILSKTQSSALPWERTKTTTAPSPTCLFNTFPGMPPGESRNSGNSMPELACQARSGIPGNETDQRHSAQEPARSSAGGPGARGLRLLQLSVSLLETEDHSLGHRPAGRGKASARSSAMLSKETEEVKSKPQQFLPIKKHPFFLSSVANSTETHRNAGKH